MDRNQFHRLLTNFTALTPDETQQLVALQHQFPFCQVLHGMLARGSQDHEWVNKSQYLQTSAVYCTDRAVLKSLMSVPHRPRKEAESSLSKKIVAPPAKKQEPIPQAEVKTTQPDKSVYALSGDSLYNEVMHDLQILKERKLQFEMTASKLEKKFVTSSAGLKPKKGKAQPDPDEGLLEEIKHSKKRIKPEGPKQKEQLEIIDQFIKTQPSIAKGKLVPSETTPKEDLAEKNTSLSDNIVSETLVEILIRQGKKEKAIEVLKKLIWKFPQKKAYFAARIEDLKKK